MLVAENAWQARLPNHRFSQARRKSRYRLREITPLKAHRRPGDLPMAGRRVLAERRLDAVTPMPGRLVVAETRRLPPSRRGHRPAEAEAIEIGQSEQAAAQAFVVAEAL